MRAALPGTNCDPRSIREPCIGALENERPWLTDPKYGGMSSESAERSYRASERNRVAANVIEEKKHSNLSYDQRFRQNGVAKDALSADDVSERSIEIGASPTQRQLRFTRFNEILLSTASRYLVKGIIPNVGLVVVWGAPKCGKSFFVFDMVAHIAAGREYRGQSVKQCPVVYFALEGQEGFAARVEAFRRVHGALDIPFYLSADRILLPKDGAAIVSSIRKQFPGVSPGVVTLDTLNRSISGSENDASDMGQYVRAADMIREAFNCVVIIIHHCGIEGSRPRGHTSLTGAADAQIAVKRDGADNVVERL